jgi:hypothetical protein
MVPNHKMRIKNNCEEKEKANKRWEGQRTKKWQKFLTVIVQQQPTLPSRCQCTIIASAAYKTTTQKNK